MTVEEAIGIMELGWHDDDSASAESKVAASFLRSEFARLESENASLRETLERIRLANVIEEEHGFVERSWENLQ